MTATVITGIGELVTNDPDGRRPPRHDHATPPSSIEGSTVAWVGPAAEAPPADEQVDAGGRAVIPGFVDSHSHLVFAGDRAAEFAARMAGETLRRRRHPDHRRRHPRRHRRAAHQPRRPPGRGDAPPGDDHGRDQERLRADRPRRGAQPRRRPPVHRGDDVPRRPRGARRHHPRGVRRAGHRPDARGVRAARPLGRRVLRDAGRSTPTRRGRCSRPARRPVCADACTPTSSARDPAYGWPASSGLAAVDHCTYLTDADVAALADSGTIATLLPGVEFSTRQPYPDARRLLDAGVRVALATDCNPGSCFTSSLPLCIALAVREMGMTPAEAVYAATASGAAALDRDDVGVLAPGPAGRPRAARRAQPRPPRLPARRTPRRRHLDRRPAGLTCAAQRQRPADLGPRCGA